MLKSIKITTKIGCPNNCYYCPQEAIKKAYHGDMMMSIDTFRRCIKKVKKNAVIGFAGMSEPLMNPLCIDMIEMAHNMGFQIYLNTTLVGYFDIYKFQKIPFTEVSVHLPDSSSTWVNKLYLNRLMDFVDSGIKNKTFHANGDLHPSINIPSEIRPIINRPCDEPEEKIGAVTCMKGFAIPELLPNGDLVLCCMDYELKHILGNLITQSVEEIYAGEEFKRVLELTKNGGSICHRCRDSISL